MESIDKHFRRITRPVFEQHGFAQGELVAQWADIVGAELAARCRPERLKWPRGRKAGERHAQGGTLTVKCAHGDGLALSYETAHIAERVNGFFGYQAVTDIKVVQGTLPDAPRRAQPAPVPPEIAEQVDARVSATQDPELKAALARLGRAALNKAGTSSP